jgi:hypothetical protein
MFASSGKFEFSGIPLYHNRAKVPLTLFIYSGILLVPCEIFHCDIYIHAYNMFWSYSLHLLLFFIPLLQCPFLLTFVIFLECLSLWTFHRNVQCTSIMLSPLKSLLPFTSQWFCLEIIPLLCWSPLLNMLITHMREKDNIQLSEFGYFS